MDSKKQKRMVIGIHGFLTGGTPDYQHFKYYLEKNKIEDFEFLDIELYDPHDEKTIKWKKWVDVGDQIIKDYISQGFKVTIVAYSMGALIATELVKRNRQVTHLIMLAPSYYIRWIRFPLSQIFMVFKKLKLYWKHRAKLKRVQKMTKHVKPIKISWEIQKVRWRLKKSIRHIYERKIDIILAEKDKMVKNKKVEQYIKNYHHHSTVIKFHYLKDLSHEAILHPPTTGLGYKTIARLLREK